MVLMKNGDVEIAGSSPETLVKVSGRKVTAMPIAGTRPRGATEEADFQLEKNFWQTKKKLPNTICLLTLPATIWGVSVSLAA